VRVLSVTFRSDHLDSAGRKLLRASAGGFKDATAVFAKPEWSAARGGAAAPISQTRGTKVEVDVELQVSVTPAGESTSITHFEGKSDVKALSFKKSVSHTLTDGARFTERLESLEALPDFVELLEGKSIRWSATADGTVKSAGSTGPHTAYVTFDKPHGKMDESLDEGDPEPGEPPTLEQDITEERLRYSVLACRTKGKRDERECVNAIFVHLLHLGVGYHLGFRWSRGTGDKNLTRIEPHPTFYEYLWLCNANRAKGECDFIAAAFVLACRMVGVKEPFEIARMWPQASRENVHPTYPKKASVLLGKYGKDPFAGVAIQTQDMRTHPQPHRDKKDRSEAIMFLDKNGDPNHFEGVAKYRNGLYAIGDAIFDRHESPDENASDYFAERETGKDGHVTTVDRTRGGFWLVWSNERFADRAKKEKLWCLTPYPSETLSPALEGIEPPLAPAAKIPGCFRWEQ